MRYEYPDGRSFTRRSAKDRSLEPDDDWHSPKCECEDCEREREEGPPPDKADWLGI